MEAAAEKPVCAGCGAEVREGTRFCYACGKPVNGVPIEVPSESIPAPAKGKPTIAKAELEVAFQKAEDEAAAETESIETKSSRVRAARERQASRVAKRKAVRSEWAEPADASGFGLMIFAAAIFIITAIIVVYLEVFK